MNIYEIDSAISSLVDPETGELLDYESFAQLQMERDRKVENMALMLKNAKATSDAIKDEIDRLQKRKKVMDNNVKRMKEYLGYALDGQKFESPRCVVSYRKSEAVETDSDFVDWARMNCQDVLIEQAPKVDLVGLKKLLKDGMKCGCARIVENQNLQVK